MPYQLAELHEIIAREFQVIALHIMMNGVEAIEDEVWIDLGAEGFHFHFGDAELQFGFFLLEERFAASAVENKYNERKGNNRWEERRDDDGDQLAVLGDVGRLHTDTGVCAKFTHST
jgi:hypothetical protein